MENIECNENEPTTERLNETISMQKKTDTPKWNGMNCICENDNEQTMVKRGNRKNKIKSPYVRQSRNFNAKSRYFFLSWFSTIFFTFFNIVFTCCICYNNRTIVVSSSLSKEFNFEFEVRLTFAVFRIPYLFNLFYSQQYKYKYMKHMCVCVFDRSWIHVKCDIS